MNLGKGRVSRLIVHQGDDPDHVAAVFAKEHCKYSLIVINCNIELDTMKKEKLLAAIHY